MVGFARSVALVWAATTAAGGLGCGSSGSASGGADAAVEASRPVLTGCNGPAPAGYTPPTLPTYSGATCPTLTLTPSGTDAGYAPPENDIATVSAGTTNMRQFKLVTPSDLGPTERVPVVFLWFWLGANAQDFVDKADIVAAAQQQRFIAVVPEKKGDVLFTWPFSATDTAARTEEEFQFFDDMLACVAAQFPANVNASCISSAGVSAGALFTDQLAPARSNVIASFLSLSGGVSGAMQSCTFSGVSCLKPWTKPARDLPGMVLWGGSMDTCVVIDFQPASQNLEAALDKEGSFYVECEHDCGHSQPPFDTPTGMTEYAAFWDFVYAHPYWLPAGESPYKENGLPSTFPSWCSVKGKGTAVERTGACGPSACSTSTTTDAGASDAGTE
jgi:hypothetical protein